MVAAAFVQLSTRIVAKFWLPAFQTLKLMLFVGICNTALFFGVGLLSKNSGFNDILCMVIFGLALLLSNSHIFGAFILYQGKRIDPQDYCKPIGIKKGFLVFVVSFLLSVLAFFSIAGIFSAL